MREFRIERDSMGEVRVPVEAMWGAQTQRSLNNFRISTERMPAELHKAVVLIKRAAAIVNQRIGALDYDISRAIAQASDEAIAGKLGDCFVLSVWQTGSGTQTNMNVNEVLARRAEQILAANGKNDVKVHPNDHVNKSQSSNDVFPTAMHISALLAVRDLLTALKPLRDSLSAKSAEFMPLIKTGRTHLQDATPITLGQEISGWAELLTRDEEMIRSAMTFLRSLAIGGTAVGTGLNAPKDFDRMMTEELSHSTGLSLIPAANKFQALSGKNELCFTHGALKTLAMDLLKIANDVRWLASGPRCGLGEITIPENEPGSSIMPGKVNPTQCEAVSMTAAQVLGNDTTIAFAAGQGNFELNVYMPVIIYNFLQSARILTDVMKSFRAHCVDGITANTDRLAENADRSLMNVTALTPLIGYNNAARTAHKAAEENMTLREAAASMDDIGDISPADIDAALDLSKMCFPHGTEEK